MTTRGLAAVEVSPIALGTLETKVGHRFKWLRGPGKFVGF
jgi:hypothetical protein